MKTLMISGYSGRMGQACARLAPEYGFAPREYAPGAAGDALLDFSHPDCLDSVLACPLPLVIGTTGYTEAQTESIRRAAAERPILMSANFSPGVYALGELSEKAQRLLPDWEVFLIEKHHAAKRDAPSGTARMLAERLGAGQVFSLRGGTVRGVHELDLLGPEESLTLTHTAESRAAFAHGALRGAAWLLGQGPGLYGMRDVYKAESKML